MSLLINASFCLLVFAMLTLHVAVMLPATGQFNSRLCVTQAAAEVRTFDSGIV
jgi:hypothetical protein